MEQNDLKMVIFYLNELLDRMADRSCNDLEDRIRNRIESLYSSRELVRLEEEYHKYNLNDLSEMDRKNSKNWVILRRDSGLVGALIGKLRRKLKKEI